MKASIQIALKLLELDYEAGKLDHCFIAPADLPELRSELINRLPQRSRPQAVSAVVSCTVPATPANPVVFVRHWTRATSID